MKKYKCKISKENTDCLILISKIELENINLLKEYLPKEKKNEYSKEEIEAIEKYNNYIDNILSQNKKISLDIDFDIKYFELLK